MDMEIQSLHESFTEKDPKMLMEHIQRMAYGEVPFFVTTLSLVYDKLVEKAFARPTPSGSGLGRSAEVQSVADPSIASIPSTSTSSDAPSSVPQAPAPDPEPEPVPSSTSPPLAWLRCVWCGKPARLEDLHDGLHCPECPPRGGGKWRPYMQCSLCHIPRIMPSDDCVRIMCRARFR